jgi:hypothetical protein
MKYRMTPSTIRRKMKISRLAKRTRRKVRAVMMMMTRMMRMMMRRTRTTRRKMVPRGRRPSECDSGESRVLRA